MFKNRKSIRETIEEKKAQRKKEKVINFSSFLVDVKHNPMILIGLGGSAIFTTLAGIFIGIAPERTDNAVTFFGGATAWLPILIGIFFAVLYGFSFPLIGEWGTYYWHKKASLRDGGNKAQAVIAYAMLGLTVIFMAVTSVYAAQILASLVTSFTEYTKISDSAQHWTVTIIPVALITHAIANIWYDHVSRAAEERRELERRLQTTEIEAQGRIQEARVAAKEQAAIAFAEEYERKAQIEAVQVGQQRARDRWKLDRLDLGGDPESVSNPNGDDPDAQNHPS